MANATAARLDPVNMKAGASFYFLKKSAGQDEDEDVDEDAAIWDDDDSDAEGTNQREESNKPLIQSKSSMRLAAHRIKSALSFFSVSSKPGQKLDDLFNDEISATFVSISDDEGSDEDEDEDDDLQPVMGKSPVISKLGLGADGSNTPAPAESKSSSTIAGASLIGASPSEATDPSSAAKRGLVSTPSFVKSMNQYMVRRLIAEEKVLQGRVQAEYGESGVKSVHHQGDLEMYSEEKQYARSTIKRSPVFRAEVKLLWDLVSPGDSGGLTRSNYVKLITKCSRLIVPPPTNKDDLLQTAMDDWDKDLEWAHDHGLVTKDAQELNFDAFFKSIYELVDIWTETAEEEEYVSMIRRLIHGVASVDAKSGALRWKNDADIKFDTYFSFTGKDELGPVTHALAELEEGDEDKDDDDELGHTFDMPYEGEHQGEDTRPSVLEGMTNPKKQKRRKSKADKKAPLSPAKVMARIAAIFQAKQQADLWASSHNQAKPIRLDRFVLRSFMQEFGTRGIARRHLRHFVVSAQKHLQKTGGKEEYPRIYFFCVLAGIVVVPPGNEFNPRLSAEYFQPALRFLYPNPRCIEEMLGDGTGKGTMLLRQAVERAAMPIGLAQNLGGPFAIAEFRKQLKELTLGNGKKGQGMVNFDKSMVLALKLWLFSDSLRGVREKYALFVLQRFFRRSKGGYGLAYEKVENHFAAGSDGVPVAMAKLCSCEAAFAHDAVVCHKCGRKREKEPLGSAPLVQAESGAPAAAEDVPPSPRVAEKLSQARDLDSKLNTAPAAPSVQPSVNASASPVASVNSPDVHSAHVPASSAVASSDEGPMDLEGEAQSWPKPIAPPQRSPSSSPSSAPARVRCDPAVEALLKSLGLTKYIQHFADEEVDMTSLQLMSEFDLAELKLTKGARVKVKAKLVSMKRRVSNTS